MSHPVFLLPESTLTTANKLAIIKYFKKINNNWLVEILEDSEMEGFKEICLQAPNRDQRPPLEYDISGILVQWDLNIAPGWIDRPQTQLTLETYIEYGTNLRAQTDASYNESSHIWYRWGEFITYCNDNLYTLRIRNLTKFMIQEFGISKSSARDYRRHYNFNTQ